MCEVLLQNFTGGHNAQHQSRSTIMAGPDLVGVYNDEDYVYPVYIVSDNRNNENVHVFLKTEELGKERNTHWKDEYHFLCGHGYSDFYEDSFAEFLLKKQGKMDINLWGCLNRAIYKGTLDVADIRDYLFEEVLKLEEAYRGTCWPSMEPLDTISVSHVTSDYFKETSNHLPDDGTPVDYLSVVTNVDLVAMRPFIAAFWRGMRVQEEKDKRDKRFRYL